MILSLGRWSSSVETASLTDRGIEAPECCTLLKRPFVLPSKPDRKEVKTHFRRADIANYIVCGSHFNRLQCVMESGALGGFQHCCDRAWPLPMGPPSIVLILTGLGKCRVESGAGKWWSSDQWSFLQIQSQSWLKEQGSSLRGKFWLGEKNGGIHTNGFTLTAGVLSPGLLRTKKGMLLAIKIKLALEQKAPALRRIKIDFFLSYCRWYGFGPWGGWGQELLSDPGKSSG